MEEAQQFKIGDRVIDEVLSFRKGHPARIRHGRVLAVKVSRSINVPKVYYHYTVKWDDSTEPEQGYIQGGGLRPE